MRKYYKFGSYKCYAGYKKAGQSYEVYFYFGKEKVFFGNFIYEKEAKDWYKYMNRKMVQFTKECYYSPGTPMEFYTNFTKNYLYKCYYAYLDQRFATYQKTYSKYYTAAYKKYKSYHKKYAYSGEVSLRAI